MKAWLAALVLLGNAATAWAADCPAALDFHMRPLLEDKPVHLCEAFRGSVVLIVKDTSQLPFVQQLLGR